MLFRSDVESRMHMRKAYESLLVGDHVRSLVILGLLTSDTSVRLLTYLGYSDHHGKAF